MRDNDDLKNIPPMVPDRDDVDSHLSNRRSQSQEIVRGGYRAEKVRVSTWPVRIMLFLLTASVIGGGYGAYYMYEEYVYDLRQTELRLGDLERRLALTGEDAEESAVAIMDEVEKTIEQYDLLWANWRNNNRTIEDIRSEIARLELANQGQDEIAANNSQAIANANQSLMARETQINRLSQEFAQVTSSMSAMDADLKELQALRSDIESIRQSVNSGDSTLLGLVGRIENMEQSMESVNAHRLQVNESLFRLQEYIEDLQRAVGLGGPGN